MSKNDVSNNLLYFSRKSLSHNRLNIISNNFIFEYVNILIILVYNYVSI